MYKCIVHRRNFYSDSLNCRAPARHNLLILRQRRWWNRNDGTPLFWMRTILRTPMDWPRKVQNSIHTTNHWPDLSWNQDNVLYCYIIVDKEIKDIRRKLPSKNIRKLLQLLIQEVRRDIYYRKDKVNHVPNNNEEVLPLKEEISYYFCNRENYPILPWIFS